MYNSQIYLFISFIFVGSSVDNFKILLLKKVNHEKITIFLLLLSFLFNANAQIRLDVEGDGTISGNLGIGTANPTAPLHIESTGSPSPFQNGLFLNNIFNFPNQHAIITTRVAGSNGGDPFISFDIPNEAGWSVGIDNSDGNKFKISSDFDHLASNPRMTIDRISGNVGIGDNTPDCKLDVSGTVCSNDMFLMSDRRFKKQINPLKKNLSKLKRLEGVSYAFRTSEFQGRNFEKGKQIGLIAQDVEKIFPELVITFEDGYKAVNYIGLIPVLIEGIKEQEQKIVALNKKLADKTIDQQQQIDELKSLVEQLITEKEENPTNGNYEFHFNKAPALQQNQPNPFRENTLIPYFIPNTAQNAYIQISDVAGKVLGTTKLQEKGPGQLTIKAATYPAGTYYYSLVVDGEVFETNRMVLSR